MDALARSPSRASAPRAARPLVALLGNPNTGKTTLFNRLTGARARVGNYPGVTVERRSGVARGAGRELEVVDLPGAYSLSARSREEQIAIEAVLGLGDNPAPALAVVVVDAGQLVRNLYLVLQLIELAVPLVVALNMMDEVADDPPSPEALSDAFGVPCVPIVARTGTGLDELERTIRAALEAPPRGRASVRYPAALLVDLARVEAALPDDWRKTERPCCPPGGRARALALWALTSIEPDDELAGIDAALRERCREVHDGAGVRDIDEEIVAARYAFLDALAPSLYRGAARPGAPPRVARLTDRIDRIVLHPVWGFAVFLLVMLLVFQSLFSWADPAIGIVEGVFGWLGGLARTYLPAGVIADLVSEGVIGGVGNVVVFLPQILLLFLLLGLLEDSGYMARAAYLMDRVMRALGLHGRAFVPMLSGCACAIPAILATRTMERERDRLLTMLVVPLMTCSARLPVYTLIIAALFPPTRVLGLPIQGLLMVAMYLFATLVTLLAAGVLGRTVVKGRRVPLLLELPPYRLPTLRSVLRQMLERAGVFLKEAGTMILACTIVLWALLSFPEPAGPKPEAHDVAAMDAWQARKLEGSIGGRAGRAIEPAIAPLGFDWKIGVGLVGAFAAREVFISTMGLVYGIGEADEQSTPLRDKIRAEQSATGARRYTPLVGLSLMVFFALACQCMSTLAVVRRETKSWRWPAFLFAYTLALAYAASFLVFQGGRLLGFE